MRLKIVQLKTQEKLVSYIPSVNLLSTEKNTHQPVSKMRVTNPSPKQVPKPYFFEQLKYAEHQQFFHEKRKRFHYKDNLTAALSMPYSKGELEELQDDPKALLDLSKKYVIEHANRRVDLFFYTLVAYYQTGVFPMSGHTHLQHGTGRNMSNKKNITEACHSSFTPSLLDETIYQNSGEEKHRSLLCGTHFMNSLNSTVELPPFVNEFDTILENECRTKCIAILRKAAGGIINPIEGLNIFLKMMKNTLKNIRRQEEQKSQSVSLSHSFLRQHRTKMKLIDLVIRGTLSSTYSGETATDDYIQLLLRMSPEEKLLCKKSIEIKERLYLKKILEMQDEILESEQKNQHNFESF